jgi:hypothetical protein
MLSCIWQDVELLEFFADQLAEPLELGPAQHPPPKGGSLIEDLLVVLKTKSPTQSPTCTHLEAERDQAFAASDEAVADLKTAALLER